MNVRFAGALAGVAVAYVIVLLPLDDLSIGWLSFVDEVALLGAPVAALLGWWLTPGVMVGSWRRGAGIGILVGALAAPMGALTIAYLTLVTSLAGASNSSFGGVPGALFIATYGLGFSVLALPVTLPAGLAWAAVSRAAFPGLKTRDPGPSPFGLGELTIILLVVAVGAALVPLGTD